jgi:hypothetical protein
MIPLGEAEHLMTALKIALKHGKTDMRVIDDRIAKSDWIF